MRYRMLAALALPLGLLACENIPTSAVPPQGRAVASSAVVREATHTHEKVKGYRVGHANSLDGDDGAGTYDNIVSAPDGPEGKEHR